MPEELWDMHSGMSCISIIIIAQRVSALHLDVASAATTAARYSCTVDNTCTGSLAHLSSTLLSTDMEKNTSII
jgi:hypothetical protein